MATYLITQATGMQSSYVMKHLLAKGAKIHAVVRNIERAPASLKSNPSITLFEGESTNTEQVLAAAKGCAGAFLNTFPIPGLEVQQANGVIAACKAAGIPTLVSSTTFVTNLRDIWDTDDMRALKLWDYFNSKAEVEAAVRASGVEGYTILRPGFIHYDFFLPGVMQNFPRLHTHAELDHLTEPHGAIPYTDAEDIGRLAAAALTEPEKYRGEEIELGSDSRTMAEVRDILARVSGREVKLMRRTWEEVEELGAVVFSLPFHLMVNVKDLTASVEAGKKTHERLGFKTGTLEEALTRDRAKILETIPETTAA